MATVKAIHGSKSLKSALDYVENPDKAEVITGINCNAETACDEMETTKFMYNKTGGRTYIHLIQSWHQDEDFFTAEEKEKLKDKSDVEILRSKAKKANEIAQKLIKGLDLFDGFEVVISTHIDREHIHNHIIINSVNYVNGSKWHTSAQDLQSIKNKSDEICKDYGLSITEKGKTFEGKERKKISTYTKEAQWVQEQAKGKNIDSYVYRIGAWVSKARQIATNKEEFIKILNEKNIGVKWEDNRKYITFTDLEREKENPKKCKIRDKTLNQYFDLNLTKDTLSKEFKTKQEQSTERGKEYTKIKSDVNVRATAIMANAKKEIKNDVIMTQARRITRQISGRNRSRANIDTIRSQIATLTQALNIINNSGGSVNFGLDMTRASERVEIEQAINTLQSNLSSEIARAEANIVLSGR